YEREFGVAVDARQWQWQIQCWRQNATKIRGVLLSPTTPVYTAAVGQTALASLMRPLSLSPVLTLRCSQMMWWSFCMLARAGREKSHLQCPWVLRRRPY